MTGVDGQLLATLACVAVAVIVLCRRAVAWWRGQSTGGCGGCSGGCGQRSSSDQPTLKHSLPVIGEPPSDRIST
jgi:hypothetical protein